MAMKLSLAGWSLVKLFRGEEGSLTLVDFPRFAREQFGLEAVELNNVFFESTQPEYLRSLVKAADSAGVTMLNIAVDEKGDLSSDSEAERAEGLKAYGAWVPVAKEIGVSVIRANSGGRQIADRAGAERHCVESFRRLCDEGRKHGVTILMENHGGLSSDPESIVRVMEAVRQTHGADAIGTLPDYGNWPDATDKYGALRQIMPYAKAVHAKVLGMDENLNHPAFDLDRCLRITREAGYDGYLGVESEGKDGGQVEGVRRAVRRLSQLI